MAATVFYADELPAAGAAAVLDGAEGHHAAKVRRFRAGDRLLLSDTLGGLAECTVASVEGDRLQLHCERRYRDDPPSPGVTVVQALPKSERADLAVDLATQAGADRIVPWQAARCVSRWASGARDGKSARKSAEKQRKALAKWAATARSAAKQARRARVPVVEQLHDTPALAELVSATTAQGGLALILHGSAAGSLPSAGLDDADRVLLIVGPEGGVDDAEIAALTSAGARTVRLGPEVLRTSAAAAVALGAIGAVTGRWSAAPPEYAGGASDEPESRAQNGRLAATGDGDGSAEGPPRPGRAASAETAPAGPGPAERHPVQPVQHSSGTGKQAASTP